MRFAIVDPYNQVLSFIDNDIKNSLYFNDTFTEYINGCASTLEFSFLLSDRDDCIQNIKVGNKIAFRDTDGRDHFLNINSVSLTKTEGTASCQSLSFELLNEEAPYGYMSDLTIEEMIRRNIGEEKLIFGMNEIGDTKQSYEWETGSTKLSRLYEIADLYKAELEFSTILYDNYSLKGYAVNIYKKETYSDQGMGQDKRGTILRVGKDFDSVSKTMDVSNLFTAIHAIGSEVYIFNDTKVIIDDDTYDASGSQGRPVKINGQNLYFHTRYSSADDPTSDWDMSESSGTYIGTYINGYELCALDPSYYNWYPNSDSIGGENGIPCHYNGTLYYLHTKYSDDKRTFTGSDNSGELSGSYIGECINTTQADPTSFNSYTWRLQDEYPVHEVTTDTVLLSRLGAVEYLGCHTTGGEVLYNASARTNFPATLHGSTDDRYILKRIEYEAKDPATLLILATLDLLSGCVPEVSYEVEGYIEGARVGDKYTIQDDSYDPPLYIEVRVVEQSKCFSNPLNCKTTFDNFTTVSSEIEEDLISRMNRMIQENKSYDANVVASNGTILKDGETTTLTAKILDNGKEVTSDFRIIWSTGSNSLSINVDSDGVYGYSALQGDKVKCTANVTVRKVFDGESGTSGEDGKTSYFHIKYSPVLTPTSEQMTDIPSDYIGTYVDFVEAPSPNPLAYTWTRFKGEAASDDELIQSIVTQFYISTSSTSQTGGTWLDQRPSWEKGDDEGTYKYLWLRDKVTYKDGSISYMNIVLDGGWQAANQSYDKLVNDLANAQVSYLAEINNLEDKIESKVSEIYTMIDDSETASSALISSTITQTANDIRALFTNYQLKVDGDDNTARIEKVESYIRESGDGIEIGKLPSPGSVDIPTRLILTSDKVAINDPGSNRDLMYILSNVMHIDSVEVDTSLYLGNFAFVPRSNGSLDFKKVK